MFRVVRWTRWSEEHVAAHAVTPGELEAVLFDPPRWVAAGREGATLVFGQTHEGRYLFLVVVEEEGGAVVIVTARDMNDSERRTYRRKAT